MFEDYEKKKRRQVSTMRSILDYGMGVLFILIGVFFIFSEKLIFKQQFDFFCFNIH